MPLFTVVFAWTCSGACAGQSHLWSQTVEAKHVALAVGKVRQEIWAADGEPGDHVVVPGAVNVVVHGGRH